MIGTRNPRPGYRPCVGLMLLNEDGRVFVARRNDVPKEEKPWQMPQGGIDDGETPRQAARRELREEIGTDKADIIAESAGWLSYDLPPALIGGFWHGRWRGQSQKWFVLRFTGTAADIDLDTHVREFDAWKWVDIDALPALVVDFKRPVYDALLAEFADKFGDWRAKRR